MKNKTTAAILALLLGGFGAHKFYMGNTKSGLLILVLTCLGVGGVIALVEGIMYLMDTDEKFQERVEAQKLLF